MTAQDALNTLIMSAAFLLVAYAMLTGGTGDPAPALVHGRHRAGRPHLAVVPDPEPDGALPFVPGPDYCDEPDDWTADLPTERLAIEPLGRHFVAPFVVYVDEPCPVKSAPTRRHADGPRHTSPSDRARQRWGVECPIFAALADQWGYTLGGDLNPIRTAA